MRLALCLPLALEEAVMAAGALQQVQELWPAAQIALIGSAPALDLFVQERIAHFVQLDWEEGQFLAPWSKEARHLRRLELDIALDLSNTLSAAWLLWLAKIEHRLGFGGFPKNWLWTRVVPAESTAPLHPVARFQQLVGGSSDPIHAPRLKLAKGERVDARQGIDNQLEGNPLPFLLGVHLAPDGERESWSRDGCRKLLEKIVATLPPYATLCILALDPQTARLCREVRLPFVLDCSQGYSVREWMALLDACDGALCSEGAPQHIAAALRVPLIAPLRFAHSPSPYGEKCTLFAKSGELPQKWILKRWAEWTAPERALRRRQQEL